MTRTDRLWRTAIVLLTVAGISSCDDGVVGSSTVTGAYTLRTVNGASLPFTSSQSATSKSEILDDVITLFQGGTYAQTAHVRTTTNGTAVTATIEGAGSYQLLGTSITMITGDRSSQRIGQINANTMTFVENGRTSAYQK